MEDYAVYLNCVVLGVLAYFVLWSIENWRELRRLKPLKERLNNIDREQRDIDKARAELATRERERETKLKEFEILVKEKTRGFPWLAKAYADYLQLEDLKKANHLQFKSYPAKKAAEEVREIAGARRAAEERARILAYQLQYYETHFPWLEEFKEEDIDEIIGQDNVERSSQVDDPARRWLTDGEYRQLTKVEKYQLALDRYLSGKRQRAIIGRDYERYIGYLYERQGYAVAYRGIEAGIEDLGIDLICTKESQAIVVQCKCWRQIKTVHEKWLFYFFGSVTLYKMDHPNENVLGVFITSTTLSETARSVAKVFGIVLAENMPLKPYPCIKCNVSKRTGERIYHLPFDQQYDRTVIDGERNELYVNTVREAESLGFRRAFRWSGNSNE